MFIKKKYEASSPFKITDVKCDRKWLSEVGDHGIIISCRINGVSCQFPFGAARWGMMVGGLGIDCDEVLFPATHAVWPERERISTGGGGQNSYALFISDSVVTSQPKENQKDFRFIGQLYSTAPIVKAFKPKLMELYNKGLLTQKFLERVGAAEPAKGEAKKGPDWTDLAYWVSKANEPEYGDMSITLKEIADHAHTTVDDVKAHAYDMLKTMRGIDCIDDVYWRGEVDSPITFTKKKMWYEDRIANEARMLQGNNYSYHRDFAGKSGSIGDLRLYDDGKMTFTSYNSKKYPSATWMFKDLDTAKDFYSALDYKLLDLSYGRASDEEFADYLSHKYPNLRVEATEEPVNEATLMIRGGKATGLLEVVDRIAQAKNQARAQDMQGIFSHYMALSNVLLNTDGITREQVPGKPYYVYSVNDFLHSYYKDACRELGRGYYELDGKYVPGKKDSEPQKPQTPPAPAKKPEGTVLPFEQCFFASMILDAKDYSGGRECSWIDPKKLDHVLATYEDDDGTPLSRKMGDLKQKYDRLKEKCLADGKSKVARVGEDYGTIDSESIPDIKDYLEMWPKHSPDGRVQQATSLWMCVAPSRDKVKFDSNEWNSRPVIDV